jgi:SSS family transporter
MSWEATKLLIDGVIIVLYFVGIISLGLYLGSREGSLKDFALGGRRVPWWAVMASIIAAETSAATFLGTPGEGYTSRNFAYVQLIAGLIIGRVLVGYIFLKPYFVYRVYTVYDYLGIRFGPLSKGYTSALFLIMRTLASGTRLFVPALAMVIAWQLFNSGGESVKFKAVDSVWPYVVAIVILTLLTCAYTAVGGIKAVIWTDVVQACLMFTGAIVAILTILYHLAGDSWNLAAGFNALGERVPEMRKPEGWFIFGWEQHLVDKWKADTGAAQMNAWEWIKLTLASPYTLASAIIASAVGNMAAFGTDQDMVQRMLTAETHKKARRSLITAAIMDLPIAAAFTFIGILLYAYYQIDSTHLPTDAKGNAVTADIFGSYILNVMPVGIRGLVLAGVFATAMGSLSAALNALATSATNDWYLQYFGKTRSEENHVAAARWFTALFAFLMIVIACFFAYAKVKDPNVRIIPVVLGIAGFILGPMLGVFLLGMLTKRRGSDAGNVIAVSVGLLTTIYLGGLHNDLLRLIGLESLVSEVPVKVAFTWFALIGAVVVFVVGLFFSTPDEVVEAARRQAEQAHLDDRPLALRGEALPVAEAPR